MEGIEIGAVMVFVAAVLFGVHAFLTKSLVWAGISLLTFSALFEGGLKL